MERVRVSAVVATTNLIPKYGGVQIPVDLLHELAARINAGDLPMVWNHDPRHPLQPTNVTASVEERDDGHFATVIEFDVDEEVWAELDEERRQAGAPGGFSFTGTVPRGRVGPEGAPLVLVAGESGHFQAEDVFAAAASLAEAADVQVAELFQFGAAEEIARFVLEFGNDLYDALPAEIVGAAAYDLIRRALRRKTTPGRTMVDVRINDASGQRQLQAVVTTDDPDVAASALRSLLSRPLPRRVLSTTPKPMGGHSQADPDGHGITRVVAARRPRAL